MRFLILVFTFMIPFLSYSNEEVSRSYFSESTETGPLVKVTKKQTNVKEQIQEGYNLCQGEFFTEFPKEPLYFNFSKKKKEVKLQLNQFVGVSKKGLACQVNGNVNCRKLIYKGDHLQCVLAFLSPGKDNIFSVNLNYDGEIIFDDKILASQKLEAKEVCKTFLKTPQVYKKEVDLLKGSSGMNYFHLAETNIKTNEIYYVYMGCGARIRTTATGQCEVAITDMGKPIRTEINCEKAFISKEGVTCHKDGKDNLLQYQFCLGGHIAVQNYNQDPENEENLNSGLRNKPLSIESKTTSGESSTKIKK